MDQRPTENIDELLRHSLPGYLFLFIVSPKILELRPLIGDPLLGGPFVLGGPLVGLLFFNLYLAIYRFLVWRCSWIRRRLGLQHIEKLKERFSSRPNDDIRAIWDYVFFEAARPAENRVLFLYSRAHSWGVIALSLFLGAGLDWWWEKNLLATVALVFFAVLVLIFLYRGAIRQGASLEFMLLTLNWTHVQTEAEEFEWKVGTDSPDGISLTDKDLYDAKATLYRDLATIFSFILGFSLVVLTIGGGNANPWSNDFVGWQHPLVFWLAVAVGVLFLGFLWKLVQYDNEMVKVARLPKDKP